MYERRLMQQVREAIADTPVILVVGARQVGKSTLVRSIGDDSYRPQYITMDDATALAAAKGNPKAFLESTPTPVVIDEIQRAPELLLPMKELVDRERKPGSYLLTGSANVLTLPKVADSLAGRMEVLTLSPLSQGEIEGHREDFIDWVCGAEIDLRRRAAEGEDRKALFERAFRGGYPEAVKRGSADRRAAWFRSYLTTLLQRDVRDLANIEGLTELPRLLSILADRAGGLLNYADVSRIAGLPQTTAKRYMALLEKIFLIEPLPAYSGSLTKRLVRSPKMFMNDTGLLAHLKGLDWGRIKADPVLAGPLMENFVYCELRKQAAWSRTSVGMFHFRTSSDQEVDIVLERGDGSVVGVEVKSGASVGPEAFKGLRVLKDALAEKFHRGIVLYAGESIVPFADDLFAIPINRLWSRNVAE